MATLVPTPPGTQGSEPADDGQLDSTPCMSRRPSETSEASTVDRHEIILAYLSTLAPLITALAAVLIALLSHW